MSSFKFESYKHDPFYKNKANRKVHFMISSYIEDLIANSQEFKINAVRHGEHKKLAKQIIQLLERKYGIVLVDHDGEEMLN